VDVGRAASARNSRAARAKCLRPGNRRHHTRGVVGVPGRNSTRRRRLDAAARSEDCPDDTGVRCGRTTARTARRGTTCPTTTPARGPTGGARTDSPDSATSSSGSAWRSRCGTGGTDPQGAWNRWRYHYPQRAFPYKHLRTENGRRGKQDPEFELLDTGVFDDDHHYWVVEVHYAKAGPEDLLMTVEVTNAGPEADVLHVLPTAWYRNTWSWEAAARRTPWGRPARRPSASRTPSWASWSSSQAAARTAPTPSCCSATTRPTWVGSTAGRGRATPKTASTTTSWRARRP
jgi:hypothetical protein